MALAQAAQGGDGVTIPGDVEEHLPFFLFLLRAELVTLSHPCRSCGSPGLRHATSLCPMELGSAMVRTRGCPDAVL